MVTDSQETETEPAAESDSVLEFLEELEEYTEEQSDESEIAFLKLLLTLDHPTYLHDMPGRIGLLREVLSHVDRETDPELWARLQKDLALSYSKNAEGNIVDNYELSIVHGRKALEVYTEESFQEEWADTVLTLAVSYSMRNKGRRAEDLERAISLYRRALSAMKGEGPLSELSARAHHNLAIAYDKRLSGNKTENAEKAIEHFHIASNAYAQMGLTERGIDSQRGLVGTLFELAKEERLTNTERAIYHFELASDICAKNGWKAVYSDIHDELGTIYRDLAPRGQTESSVLAIKHYQLSLEERDREAEPRNWARTQYNLAFAYQYRSGEDLANGLELAIVHYEKALEVFTRQIHPEEWAGAHNNLGAAYRRRVQGDQSENLELAIYHCGQALLVFTRQTFPEKWANTHDNLADVYFKRGGTREGRAEDFRRSIALYQLALRVYTITEYPEQWATAQMQLGQAFLNLAQGQDLENARQHFLDTLCVFTRQNHPERWATAHYKLGEVYLDRSLGKRDENLTQALVHYEHACEILTRQDYSDKWARIQWSMSRVYSDRERMKSNQSENVENAILCCENVLSVTTLNRDPSLWAFAQAALARVYMERIVGDPAENIERAIYYGERSLEAFRVAFREVEKKAPPEDWSVPSVKINLAIAYLDRIEGDRSENLDKAYRLCQQYLQERDADAPHLSDVHHLLGIIYRARVTGDRAENLEQAIIHIKQALEDSGGQAYPELWAGMNFDLALAYWDRIGGARSKNLAQAISHLNRALQVYAHQGFSKKHSETLNALGLICEEISQPDRAIDYYTQSQEIISPLAFPRTYRRVAHRLGDLYLELQQWSLAQQAYQEASRAAEISFAMSFTDVGQRFEVGKTSPLYVSMAYSSLKMGHFHEALEQLELGKTRFLAEALALDEIDSDRLPADLKKELISKRQAVTDVQYKLRSIDSLVSQRSHRSGIPQRREELGEKLELARAELTRLVQRLRDETRFLSKGLTTSQMLRLAPPQGALVVPLTTTKGSAAFVLPHGVDAITDEHIVWLDHFTLSDLYDLLDEWIGLIGGNETEQAPKGENLSSFLHRLWVALIQSLYQKLHEFGVTHKAVVTIVPQGGLGLLPLHATWRSVNGKPRYLLDDYAITYSPSIYALDISKKRVQENKKQKTTLLAVVNPTSDLQYASAEGESVAALFHPSSRIILEECQATRDSLLREVLESGYLHFACHGYFDWQDVMQSGLRLANGDKVSLSEIVHDLDLSAARLVMLSACESGLAELQHAPDEYIGLTTGFLQAGVPTVVSTLWSVDDLSTALLVGYFYNKYLGNGWLPSEALRAAQRWIINTVGHSYVIGYIETLLANLETKRGAVPRWSEAEASIDQKITRLKMERLRFREAEGQDLAGKPFDDPRYWAAFIISGADAVARPGEKCSTNKRSVG